MLLGLGYGRELYASRHSIQLGDARKGPSTRRQQLETYGGLRRTVLHGGFYIGPQTAQGGHE